MTEGTTVVNASPTGPGDIQEAGGRVVCDALIQNQKGLHARASAKFVTCASDFDAEVEVSKDGAAVSATSIMGLMMLAASPGCTIRMEATGSQAREAIAALLELVNDKFGEE